MKNRISVLFLFLFIFGSCPLCAFHSTSRYFPFLESPSDYIINKKTTLTPSFFFASASTADLRGDDEHGGYVDLWGSYNLKDVITSLQTINPNVDPITEITGSSDYANLSMAFKTAGKIDAVGLTLGHHQQVGNGFFIGYWLPVMNVRASNHFIFDPRSSDSYFRFEQDPTVRHVQNLTIDSIRRLTHQEIGFKGNKYSRSGFGDLDLYTRYNKSYDHTFLMKSINLNFQFGLTAPTGMVSQIDCPASIPVMGNGHWSLYGDIVSEFELKQDWKCGLMFGLAGQLPQTCFARIAVGDEPSIFSALVGRVKIKPGATFKFSPYFTLENIHDGIHFQGRYTYRRHGRDEWIDMRDDKTVKTYLSDNALRTKKEFLSKWSSHYFSLQLTYDSRLTSKRVFLDPVFYATCDFPIDGSGLCDTTEVIVGTQLHF